jgi:hypothetical protein
MGARKQWIGVRRVSIWRWPWIGPYLQKWGDVRRRERSGTRKPVQDIAGHDVKWRYVWGLQGLWCWQFVLSLTWPLNRSVRLAYHSHSFYTREVFLNSSNGVRLSPKILCHMWAHCKGPGSETRQYLAGENETTWRETCYNGTGNFS